MRVVIVGGGMSGATMALALSQLTAGQLEIDIVEAALLKNATHPGFDARAIAIADGTYQKLKKLNLWSHFAPNSTAINKVVVSDRGHLGRVAINASDYHLKALGHVVSLFEVGQSLWQALKENKHIRLWAPFVVSQISRTQDKVMVTLKKNAANDQDNHLKSEQASDSEVIEADLIIAADGTHSVVAQLLQFQKHVIDYSQHGLIANIETSIAHQGHAFELFTDQGPLALLPMTDNRSTLVWCAKPETIAAKMALSDEAFLNDLQAHFGWRLGKLLKTGKRHCYPLKLTASVMPVSHRAVLIGNAAQTLHPIAGQGFNLGLRDIDALCHQIADAMRLNQDIGSYAVLSRYFKSRQNDRDSTMKSTTQLINTFSTNSIGLAIGRNLGLSILSHAPALRDKVAHQALGWID